MRRLVLTGLFVTMVAAGGPLRAQSGEMTVATFLQKAREVAMLGPKAEGSAVLSEIQSEAQAAGDAYRARIEADEAAGNTPHSCPPPKGQAELDGEDLIRHFSSYPPEVRESTSVLTALTDLMKQRYPCA